MNSSYDYIKNLVQSNLDDYDYYVCNQVTNYGSSSSNYYEVTCSFGNNLNFNNYRVSNIEKKCQIDITTSYYNSNTLERVNCNNSLSNYNINNYDFIYTNLGSVYPSISSDFELAKNNNYSYDSNFMYMIPFTILLVVLCLFWFRRK